MDDIGVSASNGESNGVLNVVMASNDKVVH